MQGAVADDAGVVHHHVDAAERVDTGGHDGLGQRIVGDGADRRDGHSSGARDRTDHVRDQLVVRAVDHDLRAFGRDRDCERPPEPTRGAGHDDSLAVQDAHGGRA